MADTTSPKHGRYIVIDGPSGADTSTQVELLTRRLRELGHHVQIFSEAPASDITKNNSTLAAISKARQNGFIRVRKRYELAPLIRGYYGDGTLRDYNILNNSMLGLGVNAPDTVIILDAPVELLRQRANKQNNNDSNEQFKSDYIERLRTGYLWEAQQRGYTVVNSAESSTKVHEQVWRALDIPAVPIPPTVAPPLPGEATAIKDVLATKAQGLAASQSAQTSPVRPDAPPAQSTSTPREQQAAAPAAMLRLEHLSVLATMKIEQYIGFGYRETLPTTPGSLPAYHTPGILPIELRGAYQSALQTILQTHADITTKLAKHIADSSPVPKVERDQAFDDTVLLQALQNTQVLLPLAVCPVLDIPNQPAIIQDLVAKLADDPLPEIQAIYKKFTSSPVATGETAHKKLQDIADNELPNKHGSMDQDLKLSSHWPRNEFDLLPHMLYPYSNMNLTDIERSVGEWKYEKKLEAFRAYTGQRLPIAHIKGNAYELSRYTWDIQSDCSVMRDFQRQQISRTISWQYPTPRFGFDMPEIIEQAGLEDVYEKCFDISAELYSNLQTQGFSVAAQYATLLGHRLRWSITLNGRETARLFKQSNNHTNNSYRKLVRAMYDKLSEVHPVTAESLGFTE